MADYKPPSRAKIHQKLEPRVMPDDHPFRTMPMEQRLAQLEKGRQTRSERAKAGLYKKPTRQEARDKALADLEPKAIQVLREQLTSMDERVRQTAALRILEWQWGKAASDAQKQPPAEVKFESSVLDVLQSEN